MCGLAMLIDHARATWEHEEGSPRAAFIVRSTSSTHCREVRALRPGSFEDAGDIKSRGAPA